MLSMRGQPAGAVRIEEVRRGRPVPVPVSVPVPVPVPASRPAGRGSERPGRPLPPTRQSCAGRLGPGHTATVPRRRQRDDAEAVPMQGGRIEDGVCYFMTTVAKLSN